MQKFAETTLWTVVHNWVLKAEAFRAHDHLGRLKETNNTEEKKEMYNELIITKTAHTSGNLCKD